MVRNKDKTKTPSPILPLLLMIKFSPSFSIPTPWKWHRGELQSVHDGSSLLLSPTHTFPLLQYGVPPHKIQSFMNCFCVGSPQAPETCSWQETCSCVGSSPWAAAPAKILLWRELLTAEGSFRISPPAAVWGSQQAALWIPDPLWSSTDTLLCSSALPPSLPLAFTGLFLT